MNVQKIAKFGHALVPVTDRGYVIGEQHHRAKLSDHDVELVLSLLEEGMAQRIIAEKFECSRRTIRDIAKGRTRGRAPDGYRPPRTGGQSREIEAQLNSRWPSRIKPAKPEEFD